MKPICPYCNGEMQLHDEYVPHTGGFSIAWCICPKCGSRSPIRNTGSEALSAAMKRYVEPAKPTVDAVAVVRCRDCRFAQPISDRAARAFDAERVRDCTAQRGDWKMVYGFSVVAADGYCDEGERKEPAI